MATMGVSPDVTGFRVIHPLDDVAEQKCSTRRTWQDSHDAGGACFAWVPAGLPDFDDADARLPRPRSLRSSAQDSLTIPQYEGGSMDDPVPSEPPHSRRLAAIPL